MILRSHEITPPGAKSQPPVKSRDPSNPNVRKQIVHVWRPTRPGGISAPAGILCPAARTLDPARPRTPTPPAPNSTLNVPTCPTPSVSTRSALHALAHTARVTAPTSNPPAAPLARLIPP